MQQYKRIIAIKKVKKKSEEDENEKTHSPAVL